METTDSLDALISICSPVGRAGIAEEQSGGGYNKHGFQSVVETMEETGDDLEECSGMQQSEKKRRLSVLQVKSLEKNFEVENKLEPQKKIQLAKELGLQPRQVAVWFQNRRARWKTKQLERDYGVLKLNYDTLKSTYEAMQKDKEKLLTELTSLKEKLEEAGKRKGDDSDKIESAVKEEIKIAADEDGEDNVLDIKPLTRVVVFKKEVVPDAKPAKEPGMLFNDKLDIGSESDSSAILNDHDNSPHPMDSASNSHFIAQTSSLKFNSTEGAPAISTDTTVAEGAEQGLMQLAEALCARGIPPKAYQQYFRMDAESIIHDESCNFFVNVEDQAATLPWWEWP